MQLVHVCLIYHVLLVTAANKILSFIIFLLKLSFFYAHVYISVWSQKQQCLPVPAIYSSQS